MREGSERVGERRGRVMVSCALCAVRWDFGGEVQFFSRSLYIAVSGFAWRRRRQYRYLHWGLWRGDCCITSLGSARISSTITCVYADLCLQFSTYIPSFCSGPRSTLMRECSRWYTGFLLRLNASRS